MTTADLIAVMNGGIIEQAGRSEDIYDRPQREFVARFILKTEVALATATSRGVWHSTPATAASPALLSPAWVIRS
jgi:ABC-type Fe3+/spermidine/putrescine transport system ATPase subunit